LILSQYKPDAGSGLSWKISEKNLQPQKKDFDPAGSTDLAG